MENRERPAMKNRRIGTDVKRESEWNGEEAEGLEQR